MNPVFADTFYFLALANPKDLAHRKAVQWTADFSGQLITTAWVLTEWGNHLAAPRYRQEFLDTVRDLRANSQAVILEPDAPMFEKGLALYSTRMDKAWSLTDCISFAVMHERGIREALTGDHHFEQAGFTVLLK